MGENSLGSQAAQNESPSFSHKSPFNQSSLSISKKITFPFLAVNFIGMSCSATNLTLVSATRKFNYWVSIVLNDGDVTKF